MGRQRKQAMILPVEKVYLSTAEVMKYLDCSEDFIRELRDKALISFFRFGENKIWYEKSTIDKFIQKHRVI